ncbi:hypothetical protein DY000_02010976 [Brassica cretica]|uniref:F-box/LRR-repeat protein 15/At3g58940/PEG3-like LRR domain-containing protein n=1 Tax=Brassica cretica TaxID=69181 RepID=A0ABQ7CR75_BRACR|nr:hypothetical protein DY000_02010976 [Brassica cretica]
MWRKIDMRNLVDVGLNLEIMCRHAVDRSQGGPVRNTIKRTDRLGSSNLRSLRLVMCPLITNDGLAKALAKLPLLEELEFSYCPLSVESLRLVGRSCPNLKTLKLNRLTLMRFPYESDDDALASAETMPKLSHLQLFANNLTDPGLNVILDNCPNLEHLDLRECRSAKLSGDLRASLSNDTRGVFSRYGQSISAKTTEVLEQIHQQQSSLWLKEWLNVHHQALVLQSLGIRVMI